MHPASDRGWQKVTGHRRGAGRHGGTAAVMGKAMDIGLFSAIHRRSFLVVS